MDLMMAWAKTKMAHPQLVKEVYSLLYRQYNGAREVGTWEGHLQWVGHVWGCEGGGAYREHVLQASACAYVSTVESAGSTIGTGPLQMDLKEVQNCVCVL